MKVIQLKAENVKRIKVVDVVPTENLIQVTGKNGSGKSSVLDSIWWALGGASDIQSKPVRDGESKAMIRLDLGEYVVERRFTEAGGTSLIVENAEGARFTSPQKMLDKLIGDLSFDPLAFTRMKPPEQFEELRRIAKIEIDIEAIDKENAQDYEKRRQRNKEAKELAIRNAAHVFEFEDSTAFIDTKPMLDKMESLSLHNADIEKEKNRREAFCISMNRHYARIGDLEAELSMLKTELSEMQESHSKWELLQEPLEFSEFREQIDTCSAKNAEFERRESLKLDIERQKKLEKDAEELTKRMEDRNRQKDDAVKSAKMPIDGLTLGDRVVLRNGIPFDQLSSAEQLRVSVALAMAGNPDLRVIRIKEGSLLDEEGIAMLSEMATDNDYQVWMERVDSSGKIGIVMEEGQVKGAEAEPEAGEQTQGEMPL